MARDRRSIARAGEFLTRFLLDTNILSAATRDPRGPVARKMRHVGRDKLVISIIVAAEARFGVAKGGSERIGHRLEDLIEEIGIAPFEEPADQLYASVRADLERNGTPIGANDLLIAAHAFALDCVLVTDNVREFERVEGLRVENWLRD